MRVMVVVKASRESEAGEMPSAELISEMGRFNDRLIAAGVLVDGAGLHPTAKAKRVKYSDAGVTVIDGPFAETKELVAGFSIWEVKDMDEAVAWAKRAPNAMPGRSEMEIRPFYEAKDLAEFVTPEERAAPRDGERGKLGVA